MVKYDINGKSYDGPNSSASSVNIQKIENLYRETCYSVPRHLQNHSPTNDTQDFHQKLYVNGSHAPCYDNGHVSLASSSVNTENTKLDDKNIVYMWRMIKKTFSQCFHSISYGMQQGFFLYGRKIATHPILFIFLCFALCGICAIGMTRFETENRPFKLWIPQDSDFIKVSEWQRANFPEMHRFHAVLFEADNVLQPSVLMKLLELHETVANITVDVPVNLEKMSSIEKILRTPSNRKNYTDVKMLTITWPSLCAKLPSLISVPFFGRKRRYSEKTDGFTHNSFSNFSAILQDLSHYQTNYISKAVIIPNKLYRANFVLDNNDTKQLNTPDDAFSEKSLKRTKRDYDWSTIMPRGSYCSLLNTVRLECFEKSLLEIWGYDRNVLESLSQQDIIDAVNSKEISAIFGFPTNFSEYLGGITKNADGKIIGAKLMMQSWLSIINPDRVVTGNYIDDFGSGNEIDVDSFQWEGAFVNKLLNISKETTDINMYVMSAQSFNEITNNAVDGDLEFLMFGYVMVFSLIVVMLSKFNAVELRPYLSIIGITSVILAIVVSNGVASAFGFKFSPVNKILPFLLLGLGIDDMYVIVLAFGEYY